MIRRRVLITQIVSQCRHWRNEIKPLDNVPLKKRMPLIFIYYIFRTRKPAIEADFSANMGTKL